MRTVLLLASIATAAIGFGVVSAGAAPAATVTCPTGQNGIAYHYDARSNTCRSVAVRRGESAQANSFTEQSLPYSASATSVTNSLNTLAAGDGSSDNKAQ